MEKYQDEHLSYFSMWRFILKHVFNSLSYEKQERGHNACAQGLERVALVGVVHLRSSFMVQSEGKALRLQSGLYMQPMMEQGILALYSRHSLILCSPWKPSQFLESECR